MTRHRRFAEVVLSLTVLALLGALIFTLPGWPTFKYIWRSVSGADVRVHQYRLRIDKHWVPYFTAPNKLAIGLVKVRPFANQEVEGKMVVALGAKDSSAYFSNEVIPKTEYRWGWAIDGRFVRDPGADRSKGHQYLIFSPAVNDYFVVEVSDPKFLDEIDGFQIAAVQTADE